MWLGQRRNVDLEEVGMQLEQETEEKQWQDYAYPRGDYGVEWARLEKHF